MGRESLRSGEIWKLARRQYGVVSRAQLVERGLNDDAISHRCSTGRLHRLRRGVYLVGRLELSRAGELMAAVLACGRGAVLSHRSAGEHYGVALRAYGSIDITVPAERRVRRPGIRIHGRGLRPQDMTTHRGIPITAPPCTLVDLATVVTERDLETAVNEADKLDLVDTEALGLAIREMPPRAGIGKLRRLLDRATFTLTDSELERRFTPIAQAAGLPAPLTRQHVCGFRVDFYWPDLGLVVETDGLRYHRTPSEQARDRIRDQALTAAGLTPLRFTHAQVRYERARVQSTLVATAARLLAVRSFS
jgi:very-short-patch-repair endonuclease